ncbi:MAG: FkbM family methyltransferase [Beijerinckiaceae bacterium]|nr:FkbM family methyltransferase [Beijerinckiaceae bacterium]
MARKVVFDLGMHQGEDTAFYLAAGYDVVAFEANPDLVESCSRRFASEMQQGRLRIVSGAIAHADDETEITFYKNKDKSVWGTTSADWVKRNAQLLTSSIPIRVRKIDFQEFFAKVETPFYIKIDIEGADRLVIDAVLNSGRPPHYLSMESEKVDYDALVADVNALSAAGYTSFAIVQQATIPGSEIDVTHPEGGGGAFKYKFEKHCSGAFGPHLKASWMNKEETLHAYEKVFRSYRWCGDETLIGRFGRPITKPLERLLGVGLPGWHDLHARL